MNDKIKKLINGWDNENDEEKNNDIIEFINSLITEKKYDIEAEYKRKIHGMIMVAEMRIDEIKKTKPKLITTFVFFRYAIVIASIIVYVNYPVKTRSYNV